MGSGYTRETLAAKVEWEGGVTEAINGYGIDESALPEGTPPQVVRAWKRVRAIEKDVRVIEAWLYP